MIEDEGAHLDQNLHFGKETQAQRVNYPWYNTEYVKEPAGLESGSAGRSRPSWRDAQKCSRMLYTCTVRDIQHILALCVKAACPKL